MLSLNTPKTHFLSTSFLPNHNLHHRQPPQVTTTHRRYLSTITSLIIPGQSQSSRRQQSPSSQQPQQLYQPYRPPPSSPIPLQYRTLDTTGKLDVLTNRLGLWFEYAPLITSLINEGFISTTLEEITGIPSLEQNRLVVAQQVRDSLVESTDAETVAYFDPPGSPEILYEIRILNTPQRAAAAKFIIERGEYNGKKAEELARSMKDYPRRFGEKGWEYFDPNSPGDCLAFMYFRQAQEHKSAASPPELSRATLERALEVVETERGRNLILDDLEGKEDVGSSVSDGFDALKVPVVRLAYGEVAESSVVCVFPVCKPVADEVANAPYESGMNGDFGIVEAEKAWTRWVVLPGWAPVAGLKSGGGVVVSFPKARGVFPWRAKRKDAEEQILVVVDRGVKEVDSDDGFYLVAGEKDTSLRVDRGAKLREIGALESLGTVVLVVRPPREEADDINDIEWD